MPAQLPDVLLATITAHWGARCIHVVAEAGIADLVGDEALTVEELARRAGLDADALNRVLRLLASLGIFDVDGGLYRHNEASRRLRSDHPRSLRAYARMLGSDWQWRGFGALGHALKTGKTGVSHVFGKESFDYLAHHPDESRIFNEAMASRSAVDLAATLDAYDFSGFARIADIGGGAGQLLLPVLAAAPKSHGILFDLPYVLQRSAPPPSERLTLVAGDFFNDALPEADAYMLRRILHDWRDEPSLAILKAIRRAAPAGARLILMETPLPDGSGPHPAKGIDIVMLTVVGGRERTIEEYRALMEAAGFRFAGVTPTASGLALIEGEAA